MTIGGGSAGKATMDDISLVTTDTTAMALVPGKAYSGIVLTSYDGAGTRTLAQTVDAMVTSVRYQPDGGSAEQVLVTLAPSKIASSFYATNGTTVTGTANWDFAANKSF